MNGYLMPLTRMMQESHWTFMRSICFRWAFYFKIKSWVQSTDYQKAWCSTRNPQWTRGTRSHICNKYISLEIQRNETTTVHITRIKKRLRIPYQKVCTQTIMVDPTLETHWGGRIKVVSNLVSQLFNLYSVENQGYQKLNQRQLYIKKGWESRLFPPCFVALFLENQG